jgi:hypothetical protein
MVKSKNCRKTFTDETPDPKKDDPDMPIFFYIPNAQSYDVSVNGSQHASQPPSIPSATSDDLTTTLKNGIVRSDYYSKPTVHIL